MIFNKKKYVKPKVINLFFVIVTTVFRYFLKPNKKGIKKAHSFFYQVESDSLLGARGIPLVNPQKIKNVNCENCQLCVDVCPTDCLTLVTSNQGDGTPISIKLNVLDCISCSLCEESCPEKIFEMNDKAIAAGHFENNWMLELLN